MIGLADCNNFFVSCERSVDRSLENRAVVVMSNNDGCVVARSNEAKALGIKMGQPVFEIRQLVNSGKVIALSGQHLLYRNISLRIHDIFRRYAPRAIDYSVDESFLDMTGIPDNMLQEIGEAICKTCWDEMRIPVTIGFASTKTLAKIVTETCKKRKISVEVLRDATHKDELLRLLPISDLWGIGRRLSKKLYQTGIFTVADFAGKNRQWVRSQLGVNGERSWLELHGVSCIELSHVDRMLQDSISETRTFPEDIDDYDYIRARIAIYSADCAKKLRRMNGVCQIVSVFLCTNRFHPEKGIYRPEMSVRLSRYTDDTQEIANAAVFGLNNVFRTGVAYKRAGVIISDIVPASSLIPSLFDDTQLVSESTDDTQDNSRLNHDSKPSSSKPHPSLMKAVDSINSKAGETPLKLASQLTFHTLGHNDGYSSSFQAPSRKK